MRARELRGTGPGDGRYADLLGAAARRAPLRSVHAAIAYATQSGVAELCAAMVNIEGWGTAHKQWLVGVDYCRSDPGALGHLQELERAEVRVYDGEYVVGRRGCSPRVSFHPKLYLFRGETETEAVVGSGNLSRTGLLLGVEAGAGIGLGRATDRDPVVAWFGELWRGASGLDGVAERYARTYGATENRRMPTPVDEDEVPESAGGGRQLNGAQLRMLRVCPNLWIHAGRLHKNRGPRQAGNQLMLKRNSRVFFGFAARDLVPDSAIGHVSVTYDGRERRDCSLRFSNNAMDVLTLPIPGNGGPVAYDEEVLRFRRTGVRRFELVVGGNGDSQGWRRNSERSDGAFLMGSGRAWGVY